MSILEDCYPKDFFKDIIQEELKDDITVVSVDISHLLPPGENYLCELLRTVIKFTKNNCNEVYLKSFVAKRPLDNKFVRDFDKETGFFGCELSVYDSIIPFLDKLEHKQKVVPKAYHLSMESKKMIILEDLSVMNYKMANRQEGLDLEHCLLTVDKLAFFHASSLAFYEKDSEIIEKYNKGGFYKSKALVDLCTVTFQETQKICQREQSLQKYSHKINQDLLEKFYTSTKRDAKFNVLNHGDLWTNNLMFNYNEHTQLEDVLFIDFQLAVFASPMYDLHFFIASSPKFEVLQKDISTILSRYYDSLCKNAKLLKVSARIPNRKEFDEDFCNKAYIGLAAISTFTPLFRANERKDASLSNFIQNDGDGSFRQDCLNNSYYLNTFKCLLSFYESLGFFKN